VPAKIGEAVKLGRWPWARQK